MALDLETMQPTVALFISVSTFIITVVTLVIGLLNRSVNQTIQIENKNTQLKILELEINLKAFMNGRYVQLTNLATIKQSSDKEHDMLREHLERLEERLDDLSKR